MADISLGSSASVVSARPELSIHDGTVTTTSLQVAQSFGKRHRDVMRAIRNLLAEIGEEHARNFARMSQEVEVGNGGVRQESAYRMNREGFMLLAMGFTGKEALRWKLAYIAAFNRMEAELQKPAYDPARIELAHSLGPELPVDDSEVHAWTSVIDSHLSDGRTFMTVAAGNNGEADKENRLDRVQVPSDCVNAIAVGSANNVGDVWDRAPYSATGPGRSPGIIKPDVMAFGGDGGKYFHVLAPGAHPALVPQLGTSFAAPYLLRSAVGIRSILGDDLSPLAIKALLIHAAHQTDDHCPWGTGWGKPPEDIMHIITCGPGVARVVYQGQLKPGKFLRAPLPLPPDGLKGKINLAATFCFASPTDPQDAASYTRAGLGITFRPKSTKQKAGAQNPKPMTFFSCKKFATEQEQRSDQGKWETVLHNSQNMRASSLEGPAFDIHYNAREGGASTRNADVIPYALILTVTAPKCPDIYNDILRAYSHALINIQPKINISVRV